VHYALKSVVLAILQAGPQGSLFDYWILKRHALRIVLAEPLPCSISIGKDLKMILVANLLARIDVNPNRHA
jgi:hypothetical protein